MPQMQLWIIIQPAASKPFVPIGDRPAYQVAKHIVVEVKVEGDFIIEPYVLGIDRVTVYHARCKRDDPPVLTPEEEADLVPHAPPQIGEVLLCQFLEVQFRTLENLEIERINLRDDRCRVVGDAHLECRGACRRLKLLSQLPAGCTVKCALHIVVEACVVDTKPSHGQARNASESLTNQAF